jgi:hypothetical protein
MARLFQTGLEMGSLEVFNVQRYNITLSSSVTRGSWSSYSLNSGGSSGVARFSLPSAPSEFYCGFGLRPENANAWVAQFYSPGGALQCSLLIDAGGHIDAYRADSAKLTDGSKVLTVDTWYYIECHWVIDDSTGSVEVKIDGVVDSSATGVDTKGSTTYSTVESISTAEGGYYDDIYVNDTSGSQNTGYSGDVRISAYIPNADGDSSGLSLSTGTSHYAVVDERPPNDATDYAYDSVVNDYDLLHIPNTSGISTVQAVTLWLRAQKSDAGTASIAHMLKSGSTENTGSDVALSTSWTYYGSVYNVDPTDSAAWTASKLDALQIGAKVR